MAITGWRFARPLRPCRPTAYVNPTVADRDTSLERGTRTTEGQMPVFMKYDGVDGQFNGADACDFSQLTSEPTAPQAAAGITIGSSLRVANLRTTRARTVKQPKKANLATPLAPPSHTL